MHDLSSIKQTDTTLIELKLPNADETPLMNPDGTPMTVEVHGLFSDRYRELVDAQQNIRIRKASKSGGKVSFTAEEIRENRLALLVGCVKSWNITLNGVCPPCTPEEIRSVFAQYPFIRFLVESSMESPDNFLQG
jgi:hypothetical protein